MRSTHSELVKIVFRTELYSCVKNSFSSPLDFYDLLFLDQNRDTDLRGFKLNPSISVCFNSIILLRIITWMKKEGYFQKTSALNHKFFIFLPHYSVILYTQRC